MSDAIDQAASRLFSLLPAHVQVADATLGGPLFAMFRVLASGSVEIDTEIDRLSDGAFVETAGPAGLTALARLVGAPLLGPTPDDPAGANRAFIANTVRRRRAKGTARALEGVAGDVSGAGAAVVEYYQRLSRLAHLVDVRPERPALASLADGDTAAQVGTAFDHTARLTDIRSIARAAGRHGVNAVGVHVARLTAPQFPAPPDPVLIQRVLAGVPQMTPWLDSGVVVPGYFQLADRPGGEQPLVNPDRRAVAGQARIVETELVARLRRLPLNREARALRLNAAKGVAAPPPAAQSWFDADGQPFTLFLRRTGSANFERVPAARLTIVNLSVMPPVVAGVRPRPSATRTFNWREPGPTDPVAKTATVPLDAAIDPVTGRVVIAEPGARADVAEVRLAYAAGLQSAIGAGPQERNDATVPFDVGTTDFLRVVDPFPALPGTEFVATLADAIAAWTADTAQRTRGFIVLARCDVDDAALQTIPVKPGSELHIVAAQWRPKRQLPGVTDRIDRRGYLVRVGRRYVLPVGLAVAAAAPPPSGGRPGALVLDGLSLAGPLTIGLAAISVLRARYCTLRPALGPAIRVQAPLSAASITLESCIAHAVALEGTPDAGHGTLTIRGSIISSDGAADGAALGAAGLDTAICDTTLFGDARVKTLEATNLIASGAMVVTRRQTGCARYSFLGPGSQAPRRFRCQPDLAVTDRQTARNVPALPPDEEAAVRLGAAPVFLDTSLDQPTAAMLSHRCPEAIRRGGEAGTEMGVFAAAGQPIRLANIASLFNEDLPVALEGAILDDTRSRATTNRRTVP